MNITVVKLENRIALAHNAVLSAVTSDEMRAQMAVLAALVKQRDPATVRQMEREKGLA